MKVILIVIVSERHPYGPKLKKPKELKGVKSFKSYKWGGVTACQAFINGDDVWVNHHDWCSITHYGADVKYKSHFVYIDGFTAPVSKGDAWIKLERILKYPNRVAIVRQITYECLIAEGSKFCHDDERMFIDICLSAWEVQHAST